MAAEEPGKANPLLSQMILGIFDPNSGKVGTLEIPLTAVKPVEAAADAMH